MSRRQVLHQVTFSTVFSLLALFAITWSGTAHAQTYTHGVADYFAAPTEPVYPSQGVLNHIASGYVTPGSRPFDDASMNRWLATTFTTLRRNGNICGATLQMTVANLDYATDNDAMGMMFLDPAGAPLTGGWSESLTNLGIPVGSTGTINLNLASLPGGVNLIPTLNSLGYVDVFVQDDSAVDFITLVVTPCPSDVYTKDNAKDIGYLPTLNPTWMSPDIRVCWTPNCVGHQNPASGYMNHIYVTLRNNGPVAPVGSVATGTLQIYYSAAGLSAIWPYDWIYIGGSYVPSLAPGATLEVTLPWASVPVPGNYSLLTRWESARDPMTVPELPGSSTLYNVRWNNNISWKDVVVVGL
ncbi:hypothetical protein LXT21_35310 [Myxococcus sp. K38C18041901]|uniref:hypothetical protein n=1 Tax=Myxococcus guangdongensis TaxID=2906760 RepID=UPI0020A81D80|nr:hypothetical protein [Myxococcus guangdongensis]MCP3064059.1 hypothetical protein [Myxococcus guangdongensis]